MIRRASTFMRHARWLFVLPAFFVAPGIGSAQEPGYIRLTEEAREPFYIGVDSLPEVTWGDVPRTILDAAIRHAREHSSDPRCNRIFRAPQGDVSYARYLLFHSSHCGPGARPSFWWPLIGVVTEVGDISSVGISLIDSTWGYVEPLIRFDELAGRFDSPPVPPQGDVTDCLLIADPMLESFPDSAHNFTATVQNLTDRTLEPVRFLVTASGAMKTWFGTVVNLPAGFSELTDPITLAPGEVRKFEYWGFAATEMFPWMTGLGEMDGTRPDGIPHSVTVKAAALPIATCGDDDLDDNVTEVTRRYEPFPTLDTAWGNFENGDEIFNTVWEWQGCYEVQVDLNSLGSEVDRERFKGLPQRIVFESDELRESSGAARRFVAYPAPDIPTHLYGRMEAAFAGGRNPLVIHAEKWDTLAQWLVRPSATDEDVLEGMLEILSTFAGSSEGVPPAVHAPVRLIRRVCL